MEGAGDLGVINIEKIIKANLTHSSACQSVLYIKEKEILYILKLMEHKIQ